ncbi:QueT transporter family protein [Atopobacter phocae]|uniref:QueT transporter family protein n=1 Tax=Atopobacter phocae TaxID=136492 RepID=UPI000470DC63|nr:QueT transporter family protein [Atopobacter phocae]
MSNNKQTKMLAVNALVAALYVVLTSIFSFLSFGAVQFRIAEILNHLVVFNKKYVVGILVGVFASNALFAFSSGLGWYDLVFGVLHSAFALTMTLVLKNRFKTDLQKMLLNALSFAVFSFMIAIELKLALQVPFWFGYSTVAFGEVVVMVLGAPIVRLIDQRVNFKQVISK